MPASAGAARTAGPRCGGARTRWWGGVPALVLALAACTPEDPVVVGREHRFGIFRDLVLFQRPAGEGGPFFLDRFESTEADFQTWRDGDLRADRFPGTRPEARIDLHEARRFARWRFCRVQRAEEWRYACTRAGTYVFPWGRFFGDTLANTGQIGLGGTTPVGSFASGGARSGPFDLIGNVAEWTETVQVPFRHVVEREVVIERVIGLPEWPSFDPPEPEVAPYEQGGAMPLGLRLWLPLWAPMPGQWLHGGGPGDLPEFDFTEERPGTVRVETWDMPGVARYRQALGLRWWLPGFTPAPTDWLVALESDDLERLVLGGHFRTIVVQKEELPVASPWFPKRSGPTTGVRIAADPDGLLRALLEYQGSLPDAAALHTLRRFLRDPSHQAVLRPVWPQVQNEVAGGTLRGVLRAELGGE